MCNRSLVYSKVLFCSLRDFIVQRLGLFIQKSPLNEHWQLAQHKLIRQTGSYYHNQSIFHIPWEGEWNRSLSPCALVSPDNIPFFHLFPYQPSLSVGNEWFCIRTHTLLERQTQQSQLPNIISPTLIRLSYRAITVIAHLYTPKYK